MLWDIGVERVVQRINAIPGLADLIREEAGRREENLPIEWVMTEARIGKIIERAKELRNAVGPQQLELPLGQAGSHGGGIPAPGGPGAQAIIAGGQGQGAPAGAAAPRAGTAGRPLRPFRIPKLTFQLETTNLWTGAVTQHTIIAPTLNDALGQLGRTVSPRNVQLRILDVTGPPIEQIPFSVKGSRPKGFSR